MVRLAIEHEPLFAFSDHDLTRTTPTYTIDTVAHFAQALGSKTELYWIIGADSLLELATWHRAAELVDNCRMVTAVRPGWETSQLDELRSKFTDGSVDRLRKMLLPTPSIDISATDIRERIGTGRSIRYLVPDNVRTYIDERKLYHDGRRGG